ncbi:MAG: hypothetical protein QOH67_4276 [Hyphomicrobiales bacterium]|nr:hypothetical protein [Hyphomicrobiales bacterium]
MALDAKGAAALALHRFGLGPRAGSIAAIASDPRGALLAELDKPGAGQISDPTMLTSAAGARLNFSFNQQQQAKRIAARISDEQKNAGTAVMTPAEPPKDDDTNTMGAVPEPAAPAQPDPPVQNVNREITTRVNAAVNAEIGFVERLVWFWSNHFCVSADVVNNMAGGYEREAIRTHVLGRFGDMLLAAESHPAMLIYLDNFRSVGPMSVAGLLNKTGLNENLAREILELHTLGVRSVYTQDDVYRFAKTITGWTLRPMATDPDHGNEFLFNARLHEPGPQTVLGKVYPEGGLEQGRAVLADLARHPATAAHVAFKLARHFSADEPAPSLVERLSKRFLDTDGDLKEIARALIEAPETWDEQRLKLKRPSEWLISCWRAIGGGPVEARRILDSHAYLGERFWRPNAPKGFSDEQSAWIDGLAQRLDIANRIGELVAARVEPAALVENALGPLASKETRQTIARAESRQQAITLALMAPEFQRR